MDHAVRQVHPERLAHKDSRERVENLASLVRQELQDPLVREVFQGLQARMEHRVMMGNQDRKVSLASLVHVDCRDYPEFLVSRVIRDCPGWMGQRESREIRVKRVP